MPMEKKSKDGKSKGVRYCVSNFLPKDWPKSHSLPFSPMKVVLIDI